MWTGNKRLWGNCDPTKCGNHCFRRRRDGEKNMGKRRLGEIRFTCFQHFFRVSKWITSATIPFSFDLPKKFSNTMWWSLMVSLMEAKVDLHTQVHLDGHWILDTFPCWKGNYEPFTRNHDKGMATANMHSLFMLVISLCCKQPNANVKIIRFLKNFPAIICLTIANSTIASSDSKCGPPIKNGFPSCGDRSRGI